MRCATQNNGKITGQTDNISGEQVVYAYDALNRLASAGATSGTWGQSYSYDGFGDLQNQTVTAGTNNRQSTDCADANGNIFGNIAGGGSCGSISPSYSYDVTNRIVSAAGGVQYGYAPGNKRVWKGITTNGNLSQDTITFWSVTGQKLGDYGLTGDPSVVYSWNNYNSYPTPAITFALATANYYYGGKQIAKVQWQMPWAAGWPWNNVVSYVGSDRLGSFGKYYPWGQEKPSATANNTEKFTGYFRDSETGLDYADQRYHQPGMGRFLTVDSGSPRAGSPGSWNRYTYVAGDPINRLDSSGLYYYDTGGDDESCPEDADPADCEDDTTDDGGGGDNSVTVTATQDPIEPTGIDPNGNPVFQLTFNYGNPITIGGVIQPTGNPPNSWWIEPGPRIRFTDCDGDFCLDIDYMNNHGHRLNPHIHRWTKNPGEPPVHGPHEPVPPGTKVPPEPTPPPGSGPHSPWPRQPRPIITAPPSTWFPTFPIMINPCLVPTLNPGLCMGPKPYAAPVGSR
jgi:RHS repeat-associated protein